MNTGIETAPLYGAGQQPSDIASVACYLARLADLQLSHGRVRAAELLAHRAEALREAGQ